MSELFVKFEDGSVFVEGDHAFNLHDNCEVLDYVEHLLVKNERLEPKWFQTENCEYPDLEDGHVDVWVFANGEVQHATYHNPSMDNCWFELDDGQSDLFNYWCEYIVPAKPEGVK